MRAGVSGNPWAGVTSSGSSAWAPSCAGFLGAQVSPLAYLLVGVLAPLPVLVTGWRSGALAAVAVALAAAAVIFSLHPALETIWQNLGFLNLLVMGVVLASLQCRGVGAPQAIIYTVVALSGWPC